MLLSLLCILLIPTAFEAANQPKPNNRPIKLSSSRRQLSNSQYIQKEDQILDSVNVTGANATRINATKANTTRAMKTDVAKANDDIIQQENNLLGVTMYIVTRLMEIKSSDLSDLSWEILSKLFAAAISVIFGPNTNILWPQFVHIAVPFLKLLTT